MQNQPRVLILSSHYFPDNVNGTYRPHNYLLEFTKAGIQTDLVAFHYEKDAHGEFKVYHENNQSNYIEQHEDYSIIRAVRKQSLLSKLYDSADTIKFSRILKILFRWITGSFPDANHSVDGYRTMRKAVTTQVNRQSYDLIIGIFMPHYLLKICHQINKQYNIPYIIDFRDLWDNRMADPNYPFRTADRLKNFFVRRYFRKWCRKATLLTITNHYWGKILQRELGKDYKVITNGFDGVIHEPKQKFETFTIGFAGSFTEFQTTTLFIDGLKKFLSRNSSKTIQVNLLAPSPDQPEIRKLIDAIPQLVNCLPKVDKPEALKFMRQCHVLWYPAFEGIKGWCSAKLFDYIGSGTPILVAPGDHGIVSELIDETKTGKVAYDALDFATQLENLLDQWEKNGAMHLPGRRNDKILQYTWSNQAKNMADIVFDILKGKTDSFNYEEPA